MELAHFNFLTGAFFLPSSEMLDDLNPQSDALMNFMTVQHPLNEGCYTIHLMGVLSDEEHLARLNSLCDRYLELNLIEKQNDIMLLKTIALRGIQGGDWQQTLNTVLSNVVDPSLRSLALTILDSKEQ